MLKTVDLHPGTHQPDYERCMGMLTLLGATSAFGELPLTRAVAVLHGALKTENFRIYLGSNNRPSAAVIWAYLSEAAAEDYVKAGFLSKMEDWNSGNQLWFLHVIAEGGKIKDIIEDSVNHPTFKEYDCGYMLRVGPTGTRRIVSFTRSGMKLVQKLPK